MLPFYDPTLTYEQNYARGPFGAFAEPVADAAPPAWGNSFLGRAVGIPFGIPAGPLLNARFVAAAFAHGYDLAVYKTVRTRVHPSNPFPNVLAVHVDGDLTLDTDAVCADGDFTPPLSISNSFGVPSRDPDIWQPDMAAAVAAAGNGQLLIGSFQGTRGSGGELALVADHLRAARLVVETGAPVLELNLSCPNEGAASLLCFDTPRVRRILAVVKDEIGDVPLLVKLAYFDTDAALERFVDATAEFVAGYAAVNTIPARLVTASGAPALGAGRESAGVCGDAIRWAGLDMTRRLARIRALRDADFAIVGTGGVTSPADYLAYRQAGADAVMSATGAMWHPHLAREVARVAAAG
ncbi:tRNA-dihydrouridine synthase [Microbacterium binotii]|uniref:tRNA-dihydrouridine synthase n=1 Tax=Microbacterium binotii TaxID=462710 RepID=UPI001F1768F3|nr:tRNA-dihydrouridine synthase [Microbacterium binotii]UIN30577.1 tRNA-dihydrouridine synthase [Microbacterium binotii]